MEEKKMLVFSAYTGYGKCDSVDWDLYFEVTEEEYQRLIEAAKKFSEFSEAKEVSDIYDRVYDEAVRQSTEDLIENDLESIEDYLDEGQSIEEWSADEVYDIGVNFPYGWDKYLEQK